jgi:hypothetical protein
MGPSIPNVIPFRQQASIDQGYKYRYKKDAPQSQAGSEYEGSNFTPSRVKSHPSKPFAKQYSCQGLLHPSFGRKTNVLMYVVTQMRYGSNMSYVSANDLFQNLEIDVKYAGKLLRQLERDSFIAASDGGYLVNPHFWFMGRDGENIQVENKWIRLQAARQQQKSQSGKKVRASNRKAAS